MTRPARPRPVRRVALAVLAPVVAASLLLAACGRRGAPIDPERTWRYGVPDEHDRVIAIGGGSASGAAAGAPPPPASAPLPTPSPLPTTPAPTAAPALPAEAPASAPAAGSSGSTAVVSGGGGSAPPTMAGGYKVVPVPHGATIRGTCRMGGPVSPWKIRSDKDNDKGCGDKERATERLVVGPDGAVANCVVRLAVVKEGKDFPPDKGGAEPTFLVDQKTCRYRPHVGWMRTGTQVVIGNDDGADHNIHSYFQSVAETVFNVTSAPGSRNDDLAAAFLEKPGLYLLKCDIHPWMSGTLFVSPHPYFDVTSAEATEGRNPGEYVLADVPEGEYDLVAWHEGMTETPQVVNGKIATYVYGPDWNEVQKVSVHAGETKVVDFTVPPPPAR